MARRELWLAPQQDPVRTELLREMVREAERVIDGQLKAIEELDDKGEGTIRLAVLGVVLGLTLGSLAATSGDPDKTALPLVTLSLVAAGLLANLVALYMVVHAYTSLRGDRNAESHPDVPDLVRRAKIALMDLEVHFEGLLQGLGEAQVHNLALMEVMARWRRRGMRVLAFGAVPLHVLAMVLVALLTLGLFDGT